MILYCQECGGKLAPWPMGGYRCGTCEIILDWTPASHAEMIQRLSRSPNEQRAERSAAPE